MLAKHDAVHHADSVFLPEFCFDFEGKTYELLEGGPFDAQLKFEHKYRVVFDYDDYDYVDDPELEKKLDAAWAALHKS